MKKVLMLAVVFSVSLWTGGCVFTSNDYVENAEFDLELPKPVKSTEIRLGVFKNLSGSDRRFLMRRGDGQVVPLEYQRWRMSPELMLMRCMYGCFTICSVEADGAPQLGAVLYRFEFDERDDKAHLAVDFLVSDLRAPVSHPEVTAHPETVRCDVAVPVKASNDLAAARAAAMSECARLAIEKLSSAMNDKRAERK